MGYCTWEDAAKFLGKSFIGVLTATDGNGDPTSSAQDLQDKLQSFCDQESVFFDRSVDKSYVTPFDLATQPDAYADAQLVVAQRAAAKYFLIETSAQATDQQLWYAKTLRDDATALALKYETRREGAADAVENAAGRIYAPDDGSTTGQSRHPDEAAFHRGMEVSGSPWHY
jgi:hypothetical protein